MFMGPAKQMRGLDGKSLLFASAWSIPRWCGHLESESADRKVLSLLISFLCHSFFQISIPTRRWNKTWGYTQWVFFPPGGRFQTLQPCNFFANTHPHWGSWRDISHLLSSPTIPFGAFFPHYANVEVVQLLSSFLLTWDMNSWFKSCLKENSGIVDF